MTVKELITALKRAPEDAPVFHNNGLSVFDPALGIVGVEQLLFRETGLTEIHLHTLRPSDKPKTKHLCENCSACMSS